jgi:hypothetical protein
MHFQNGIGWRVGAVLALAVWSGFTGCANLELSDPIARDQRRIEEQQQRVFDRDDSAQEARYQREQRRLNGGM